jgi:hypothetical protein
MRAVTSEREESTRSIYQDAEERPRPSVTFLSTVKKIQVVRRLERIRKAQQESNRSLLAEDPSLRSELTLESERAYLSERGAVEKLSTIQVLLNIVLGKGIISLCLLAGPLAILANILAWSDTAKFWLNFVVMIPLASILGDFTEEVALHTNEVRDRPC